MHAHWLFVVSYVVLLDGLAMYRDLTRKHNKFHNFQTIQVLCMPPIQCTDVNGNFTRGETFTLLGGWKDTLLSCSKIYICKLHS